MLRFRTLLGGALCAAAATFAVAPASASDGTQVAAQPSHPFVVRAVINEGAAEIPRDVSFSLHRLDGNGEAELAAEASGGIAELAVPQGEYLLTTAYGATLKQELVHVHNPATAPHTVNLNAGEITLSVIPGIGRPALQHPIEWHILTYGRDAEGHRHVLHEVTDARPYLVLPAGWYFVAAHYEGRRLTHTIEVGAGNRFDYTLVQPR